MRYNAFGYTLDFAKQCAAWTINNQGPSRKQCGLPASRNVGGWIYLCNRHHELIEREFEAEIDNLNSRRVANMQARLESVAHVEAMQVEERREIAELMAEIDHRRVAQTVYFIRCQEYMKIGISKDVNARLNQIRKGGGSLFPRLLDVQTAELIATEPGGLDREKELHKKFKHLRHTGEWFTETPELTKYIDSINNEADTDDGARLSHSHPNAARRLAS